MTGNGYKISVERRLTSVEVILKEIKESLFTHIADEAKSLDKFEKRFDNLTWLLVTTLVAVIANIITRVVSASG